MRNHLIGLVAGIGFVAVTHTIAAAQSATVRNEMEGQELFRTFCASCHGPDGRGNGPVAFALKRPPADLTTIASRNGGVFPRERLIRYITNGEPSTPAHGSKDMPVWGPNLTALAPASNKPVSEHITNIVAYLESIQPRK
jgi:mono/diheme cytochrome c family protein